MTLWWHSHPGVKFELVGAIHMPGGTSYRSEVAGITGPSHSMSQTRELVIPIGLGNGELNLISLIGHHQ